MRISDWSSDVCSSDLSSDDRHTRGRFHLLLIIAVGPAAALGLYREIRNNRRITPLPGKYYAVDVDVHRSDHPLRSGDPRHLDACWNRPAVDPSRSKIRRTSCWARVVQYV